MSQEHTERSSLLLVHFLYDSIGNPWLSGGGAVRAHEIGKRLVAQGHCMVLICGGFPGSKDCVRDGIHYCYTPSVRWYALSRLFFSIFCRLVFTRLKVPAKDPRILVVDDISAFSLSMPWLVWRGPIVGIAHHVVGSLLRGRLGLPGILVGWLEKWNIRHHSDLIAVSHGTKAALMAIHPSARVQIVHNGVTSPDSLEPMASQRPYFLYLGRIDFYNKGIDILLEAFQLLETQFPQVDLLVAGGGKDEALLVKACEQSSGRIRALGKVSEKDKWKLMSGAVAFCMPSRFEGWGIAAIEAACCACPVVATAISGLDEAVLDGRTGVLVAPGEGKKFADAMARFLVEPTLRDELGHHAQDWGGQWSWDVMAERQLLAYCDVLSRRTV